MPKNVLDIVAAQTVTWMGLFYCPLLPLFNSVFIFLTFYIKKVRGHGLGGSRTHLEQGSASAASPTQRPFPGPPDSLVCANGLAAPNAVSCSPVHPPEELQGVPSPIPGFQLYLLLPAGAHPRPACGHRAAGLRGQQVRGVARLEAGRRAAPPGEPDTGPLSTASTPPGTAASSPTTRPPGRWSRSWWPCGCHPLASVLSTTWAPMPSAFPSSSCSGSSQDNRG